jgi:nucleoside phosphorylase
MEGYALYYTAHVFDKPALWIKSVSDMLDSSKNDDYHQVASYTSACLLLQFIKDKLFC